MMLFSNIIFRLAAHYILEFVLSLYLLTPHPLLFSFHVLDSLTVFMLNPSETSSTKIGNICLTDCELAH
jgi:hypothetical protein